METSSFHNHFQYKIMSPLLPEADTLVSLEKSWNWITGDVPDGELMVWQVSYRERAIEGLHHGVVGQLLD